MKKYWNERIKREGLQAVLTPGSDYEKRTKEEIKFMVDAIRKYYPDRVNASIEFGAGHGRLLEIQLQTAKDCSLLDLAEGNYKLFLSLWGNNSDAMSRVLFHISPIAAFSNPLTYDYAMTFVCLQHIVDESHFVLSVRKIVDSVKEGGHIFCYESSNDDNIELAGHMGNRTREQFLAPFLKRCEFLREIPWLSSHIKEHIQVPHRLYIFKICS